MDETQRRLDEVRTQRSELENHLIDEYRDGKISRREFVRRGTVVGMSIPLVSFIVAACGGGDEQGGAETSGGAQGGTEEDGDDRDRCLRQGRADCSKNAADGPFGHLQPLAQPLDTIGEQRAAAERDDNRSEEDDDVKGEGHAIP